MHGLILDSHVTSWTGPEEPMVERDPFPVEAGFDRRVSTAFLDYVATSEGQLSNDLRPQTGRWAFLPFESSPVLRFDNGDYVVLDQQLLQDRITRALYWAVHDSEKRRSEASRAAFAAGFGHVVEDVVRSDLRRIASAAPSIPGGPGDTYFSEDAIVAAYSAAGRIQGKKNADAAIWTPTAWLVVEIVNGALRIPTRQGGNLESFREDTLRLVLEKLEQLDSTAKDLLRAPQDLAGITNPPGMRIQPVLIQGGQFPVHPATIAYIDEEVRRRRLFSDARIKRLAILEASDLDLLESEVERGAGLAQLLDSWLASERRAFALKNYVLSRRPSVNPDDHRPRRLQGYSRLKEILTSLPGGRLQTEQDEVRPKGR